MTDHAIHFESREIQTLYRPQVEQLGMELHHRSGGLEGQVDGDICQGRFQANPAGPHCLVIWHDITFLREMDFSEYAMTDYACLTLDESPASDPAPYGLQPCTKQEGNMVSLVQQAGTVTNRKPAGFRSRTRSICILPDYFMELENQWPGQVKGLFDTFCQPWPSDIALTASTALSNCAPGRQGQTEFLIKAHIDLLLARLAQSSSALVQSHEPSYDCDLVQQAKAHIQSHLGGDLSIDRIAQTLYVGRTRLCLAFKRETGTSLARYIREQRMDRARHLLSSTEDNVAWIGRQVGYMRPSSFSAVFTRETGVTPIAWREQYSRVK
ncbi:helix-turn-helix domain-containing protein [Bifidobacterium asteroides]|uniref:helix-turn-helix domain-containing protein n=1 Tax=Bifidobacterium asteroides TaxID=1684 RepID=UPI0027403747|nr:AraC family transcriptional regulator [Bifidobacterium asteroides]WLT10073.1 AraC family transcriptional regulator [Bifidobacterium asteroides]